uniref:Uncharacterized protein n=1 Tax=Anguilla anguilla TaxID=7936 RepID=A0A0E9V822_ANGAN
MLLKHAQLPRYEKEKLS